VFVVEVRFVLPGRCGINGLLAADDAVADCTAEEEEEEEEEAIEVTTSSPSFNPATTS
jgi:hypothetical protein